MLSKDKAVVVFSGGQDSTTCLFWAKKHFNEVYALSFRYGQKHEQEVDSLTHSDIQMDKEKPATTPPNTFVPGRNLFFLSIAAVYARNKGAMNIVTGVSQTDFSGYPDCRDSFIRSLNVSLNLSMDEQFVIHTPLMWLDKSETWALADDLGVFDLVLKETMTCYNGIPGDGCGECPACKLRRRGLETYLKLKSKSKR